MSEEIQFNKMAFAVDVAIFNASGQVLLGKRLGAAGHGAWGLPGGHIHDNEDILVAAQREIIEELGENITINLENKIIAIRDNCLPPQFMRHITIIIAGKHIKGDPVTNEPLRCEGWGWFDLNGLPSPLFSKIGEILAAYTKNVPLIV